MSDRYDPKLSVRPPGDRRPSEGRGGQEPGADDPLVELARIVSGRSVIEDIAAKPAMRAVPQPAAQQPLPSEADLARDLEAELLNELQASFSMIPEIVGRPAPPPPAPPPEAPASSPVAAAPAPLPDIFEAVPEPSAPLPDMFFRPPAAPAADAVLRQPAAPLQPRSETLIRPPQAAPKRESLAARMARAMQEGEAAETPAARMEPPEPPRAPAAPAARLNAFRPPDANGRPESASTAFRPPLTPHPPASEPAAPPPRAAPTRWDPVPEPPRQPAFEATRFALPRGEPFPVEAPALRAAANMHGLPAEEDPFTDELPLPTVDEAYFDEAPGDENFDLVPGYGDDELLPYPEEDLAAYASRRSRRGPLAIAALLTVVVVGGAAAVMLRPGGSDVTPPIIVADTSPTKVTPDNGTTGDGEGQAKLVYDRVDPGAEVADSQLVISSEDPIADIPPIPEEPAGSVSRVILQGGPGIDAPAEDADPFAPLDLSEGTESFVEGSASDPEPIGPRRVRTVVVRPDGTIVSSEAAPAEEPAQSIADLPPPSATPPAPAADENPLLADDFGVEPIDNPVPDMAAGGPASASVPDIPPPSPPSPARPPPPQTPTVVATTGGASGPIDLTPGTPAPQSATAAGGGFLVQVSSQRSQETALSTFRDLQRRYPGILGDREPNIQRADLGERGVYYRVRVGYPTRDQAVRMCETLKAAGGDCLLAAR